MSKGKIDNGVTIDNRIRITSELTANKRVLYILLQIVISFIGTLTVLYSWIFGMDMVVDHKLLITGILVSVVVCILIQEISKARLWIGIGYLAIIGVLCYYYWEYLKSGFYCIENAIIKYAAEYYKLNPFRYMVYLDPYKSTTYLFLTIAQLIVIVVTLEVSKHYMRMVYTFLVLLFYGTLLALGITPNGFCLITQMAVYLGIHTMDRIPNGIHRQYLGRKSETYEASADGKRRLCLHSALTISAVFLIAYLLVRVVITPYFYDKKVDLGPTKKKIQKAITEFSVSDTVNNIKNKWSQMNLFDSQKPSYSGGLDSGKIGDVGSISFNGEVALTVAMDSDVSYLYLKGFSGAVYKGDEWAQLSEEDSKKYEKLREEFGDTYQAETLFYEWLYYATTYGIPSSNFNLLQEISPISMDQRDIYVKYKNANRKFLYAPYTSNYQGLGDVEYLNDSYIKPMDTSQVNYLFTKNYVSNDDNASLNELIYTVNNINENYNFDLAYYDDWFGRFEKAYRKFAHEVYTRLPANGLEQLKSLDLGVSYADGANTYEIVQKVIEYLRTNTTYSLSPGVPHTNQDFAEYFLFDAKKGFCSHYATAAVLLLRNYGVPARYIEGYVVTKKDIEEGELSNPNDPLSIVATVRDYNAHAWVEVYIDGAGWVPVEVTNGYSEEGVSNLIPEIEEEATEEPEPNVTSTPTPTTPQTTEPKITQKPTIKPTTAPTGTSGVTDVEKEKGFYLPLAIVIILIVLLSLAATVGIFYFRYYIHRLKMKQFLERGSQKHKMIANYMAIERLLLECKVTKSEAQTYEEFAKQAVKQCYWLPDGFEDIVTLVLKAYFSDEDINGYDTKEMCRYYREFRENCYESLSKKQQFIFKYWKLL